MKRKAQVETRTFSGHKFAVAYNSTYESSIEDVRYIKKTTSCSPFRCRSYIRSEIVNLHFHHRHPTYDQVLEDLPKMTKEEVIKLIKVVSADICNYKGISADTSIKDTLRTTCVWIATEDEAILQLCQLYLINLIKT
jgi:hypothetical protein